MKSLSAFPGLVTCVALGCQIPTSNDRIPNHEPSPVTPRWIQPPYEIAQWPRSDYLLGYGQAEGLGATVQEEAILRAREHLASEIEVHIEGVLETMMKENRVGSKSDVLFEGMQKTRQTVAELLRGCRVVARHEEPDPKRTHVLVVMGRDEFFSELCDTADNALEASQSLRETARAKLQEQEIAASLGAFASALRHDETAEHALIRGRVVRRDSPEHRQVWSDLWDRLSRTEVDREIQDVLDSVRIEIASGDFQEGRSGTSLEAPLVIRALWQRTPMPIPICNLPVDITFVNERLGSRDIGTGVTDREGYAKARLAELQTTGCHANQVRFGTALDLGPSRSLPATTFTVYLPTIQTSRVMVVVDEEIDGEKSHPPIAEERIIADLTDLGFLVVTRPPEITSDTPIERLKERCHAEADYVVSGLLSAHSQGERRGIFLARTRVSLRAIDLQSGHVLSLAPDTTARLDGSGQQPERACRVAIERTLAEGQLLARLADALRGRVERGMAWE